MMMKKKTEKGLVITDEPNPLPSTATVHKIVNALKKNRGKPTWIRKLAKETGLSATTVSKYVYHHMNDYIAWESVDMGGGRKMVFVTLIKEPVYE
jgi:response regulator of citrate/malate metabolism